VPATLVALGSGQDEDMLIAVVAMIWHTGPRRVTEDRRRRTLAIVSPVEPVLLDPRTQNRPRIVRLARLVQ
jgi:hypothetical protein